MSRCRWVYDKDVPDGRFLVPGCMNRAVHDDDADCHCVGGELTVQEEVQMLRAEVSGLRAALAQPGATVIAVRAPSSKADHIAALAQPSTEGVE